MAAKKSITYVARSTSHYFAKNSEQFVPDTSHNLSRYTQALALQVNHKKKVMILTTEEKFLRYQPTT